MDVKKFHEFMKDLEIDENQWSTFEEIESIVLKSGLGIYPNWAHTRFKVADNHILVCHGNSKPYGARLNLSATLSGGKQSIMLEGNNIVPDTQYYKDFRLPKIGDHLVVSDGDILDEAIIMDVEKSYNMFRIELSKPLQTRKIMKFSFYDPQEYDKYMCSHSSNVEGIYMKLIPNKGKEDKKYGVYHETIKIKDIESINLKINTKIYNKIYKIK